MFKKCFTNILSKSILHNRRICINFTKTIFSYNSQCESILTKIATKQNYKWLNQKLVGRKRKCMIANLLMVTYYYRANNKKDAEQVIAEIVDVIQSELTDRNYEEAENVLAIGLKVAEEHKLYKVWSELSYTWALIALTQNQMEKAENILVNTIEQLYVWGFKEHDHQIIDLKFCLANVFSLDGKTEMAELGFKMCLSEQENKVSSNSGPEEILLYVDILFYYGLHLMRHELFEEAKENIDKAYTCMKELDTVSFTRKINILYKKAELNQQLGNYRLAFDDIIEVTSLATETGSPDIPFCYKKLAEICIKLKLYKEAKQAYEEALKYAVLFYKFDFVKEIEQSIKEIEKCIK